MRPLLDVRLYIDRPLQDALADIAKMRGTNIDELATEIIRDWIQRQMAPAAPAP